MKIFSKVGQFLLAAWRNFFVGRNKLALAGILIFASLNTTVAFGTSTAMGFLVLYGWVFGFPTVIYMIDTKTI